LPDQENASRAFIRNGDEKNPDFGSHRHPDESQDPLALRSNTKCRALPIDVATMDAESSSA
jgi:hypothetical protein